jgi:hypothetical protein
MPDDIFSFRTLFHVLVRYEGANAYHEVLLQWLPQAQEEMGVLGGYGLLAARTWKKDEADPCNGGNKRLNSCLEHLYALSRMSDLLLLPFEPVRPELMANTICEEVWQPEAVVSAEQRQAWWTALGMTPIDEMLPFHRFYHEIVSVEQADDPQEPITLTGTLWTGFTLGQMMFCRSGVSVRGGRDHIIKEIAETSRLYWAYHRNNRRAVDRSHGWGHNSQWATDFRRDNVAQDAYYYNVDGEYPLIEADGSAGYEAMERESRVLSADSAVELMMHRCFIRTAEQFYDEDFVQSFYVQPRAR